MVQTTSSPTVTSVTSGSTVITRSTSGGTVVELLHLLLVSFGSYVSEVTSTVLIIGTLVAVTKVTLFHVADLPQARSPTFQIPASES